jgi:glycosyltransferase involved in cell wall biosynthesis
MRILTFTTLYPNPEQPHHGIFVENRLRHILAGGGIAARVVAPVPWFPFTAGPFGQYAAYARVPAADTRFGIEVLHPRYAVIPKIGMNWTPGLLARASTPALSRLRGDGFDFDLIDAHYFYPDGVAAARLARAFRRPLVISARGTDINLIPDYPAPRRMILETAAQADAVIAVSQALAGRMEQIGIPSGKIAVLPNGVDAALFAPPDRGAARAALGLDGPVMIAVGNLLRSKGQDVAIRALAALPGWTLLVVGGGADAAAFETLARALGVGDRVRFLGRVPHDDLARFYAAADVSVLASMREGWPNVLLESMACGTPVIASDVGGVREIVSAPEAGLVLAERTPEALAEAARALLAAAPARERVRAHALKFDWERTAAAQRALYERLIA